MSKWSFILLLLLPALGLAACAPTSNSEPAEATAPAAAAEPARVSDVVTRDEQQAMTPQQVFDQLKEGNRRFVESNLTDYDYQAQAAATAAGGQYPKAIIVGCLDSRVPPEIVFDQGIGDVFVGRVAGNFENVDLLGSLEFGAKVAGSKLIVVLGHTQCGAVKGAADGAELGNLTEMLDNIEPALDVARDEVAAPHDSSNDAFVQAAIEENVRQTVADILERSAVLSEMVEAGELMVVGGVYELSNGEVTWLEG